MASEIPQPHQQRIDSNCLPAPSHNDVITAREQRSHIAIIQMAPPAQGSSSASGKAVPSTAASASVTTSNGTRKIVGERVSAKGTKKKKRHHCSVQGCTYSTGHTKDLARHMRKHTGEKPFRCDRCTKSFTRYDKLVMHIRIHEGHKPFACPRCDYAAIDSSSLKKHIRTHGSERPYKCNFCPYASKSSSQLVVHIRRHTGDSPYLCTFSGCDASFKTSSDLTRHSRLHTGQKPFKCRYCDYKSAVKSNVTLHMITHTNPRRPKNGRNPKKVSLEPEEEDDDILEDNEGNSSSSNDPNILPFQYSCKLCDHKADTIELFTLHIKESHPDSVHTKKTTRQRTSELGTASREPPRFQCPSCPATFISEGSLRCHVRQHGTVPNKPANVDPEIYSPTPTPTPASASRAQRNYPEREPYTLPLHELQRLPLVHSSVITENPSVITSNNTNGPVPVPSSGTGNAIQHHHYDEETGHLYVITYNHID